MSYKIGILADIAEGLLKPEENSLEKMLARISESPELSGLFDVERHMRTNTGKYQLYCQVIDRAKEKLREEITEKTFALIPDKERHYVQFMYSNLKYLSAKVNKQKSRLKYSSNKRVKIHLQKALDELQYWMEWMYVKFLDENLLPSKRRRLEIMISIRQKLRRIEAMVPDGDPTLINLLNEPLNNALEESQLEEEIYNDLLNFQRIVHYLYEDLSKMDSQDNEQLVKSLIRTNFNHHSFYSYYRQKVLDTLVNIHHNEKKREHLDHEIREIDSMITLESCRFKKYSPTVKDMIMNWLEVEREKLSDMSWNNNQGKEKECSKLTTSLTVAQLTYLFRLLTTNDVIVDKKPGCILDWLGCTFRTEKADEITLSSLRTKYYNVQPETSEQVLQKLENMVVTERQKMALKKNKSIKSLINNAYAWVAEPTATQKIQKLLFYLQP